MVLHDGDVRSGREPVRSELRLNALIRRRAGARRTVVLEPDFETVVGYHSHDRKPERALKRLAGGDPGRLPEPLVRVVQLALESAHPRPPSYS